MLGLPLGAKAVKWARQAATRARAVQRGYCVRVRGRSSREEIRHGDTGRLSEEHDRNKRRLEAQLVDCAHIFADIEIPYPPRTVVL